MHLRDSSRASGRRTKPSGERPIQESLLIVEDEAVLARELRRGLEAEGFVVRTAAGLATARDSFSAYGASAVILDRSLPDGEGLSLLRELRAIRADLPAIVITARDAVTDRVAGLDAGADDYLVKPFAFAELLARIRALLRRCRTETATTIRVGGLELDLVRRRVSHAGDTVELTSRQFELLEYLSRRPDRPAGRDELLRDIWGEPPGSATNVVEVSVNHLRRKFSRRGWPPMLETVRGQGYVLRGEPCED